MEANSTKQELMNSLRVFKSRRDDLLHEDTVAFDHHLERFIEFWRSNPIIEQILAPFRREFDGDVDSWWNTACEDDGKLTFPSDQDQEFILRYHIIEKVAKEPNLLVQFGVARNQHKENDWVTLFRSL